MPRRREEIAELRAKIASLENLRPELGEEFVNQKIDELHARIQAIQSGGASAVCTFPQGAGSAGVWDMSGNAWEWTCAWYDEGRRTGVVRGGSWIGYQWCAHTAFCNWSIPRRFNDDLGFRVVIAPQKKA